MFKHRLSHVTVLFALLITLTLVGLYAAETSGEGEAPTGALVVLEGPLSRVGVGTSTAIRISDRQKLATLESFFPGYRKQPSSRRAGGWEAKYRIYFDFPQGKVIRVTVSQDAKSWTTVRGDFAVRGNFGDFVDNLQQHTETRD